MLSYKKFPDSTILENLPFLPKKSLDTASNQSNWKELCCGIILTLPCIIWVGLVIYLRFKLPIENNWDSDLTSTPSWNNESYANSTPTLNDTIFGTGTANASLVGED